MGSPIAQWSWAAAGISLDTHGMLEWIQFAGAEDVLRAHLLPGGGEAASELLSVGTHAAGDLADLASVSHVSVPGSGEHVEEVHVESRAL